MAPSTIRHARSDGRRSRDPPRRPRARRGGTAHPGYVRQADVGERRDRRRLHVRVDDPPDGLVGVVDLDGDPEQRRRGGSSSGTARRLRCGRPRSGAAEPPSAASAVPAMIPHASFGYSARAWATIASAIARGRRARRRPRMRAMPSPRITTSCTPPSRSSSISSEVALERARREVLPAAVGEQRDDRPAVHPLGLARGGDEHRAARRPGEDPLLRDEVPQRRHGVPVGDEVLHVEDGRVEDLGHEPLVERAQALDVLAGQRLRGDDPRPRLVLAAGSARRPSASRTCPARRRTRRSPGSRRGSRGRSSRSAPAGWPGCRTGRASRSASRPPRAPWPARSRRSSRARPGSR